MNDKWWQGRRVLVTGATGLVGSWLIKELLTRSSYILALVRDFDPQSEFIRSGDFKNTSIVSGGLESWTTLERAITEHDIEIVFHLAAQTIVGVAQRAPLNTFEANIRGTYNLLEACRVHSNLVKAIVIASSDKAYGESEILPYTEEMPLQGKHPYEVSKSCADLIATSYFSSFHLPVAIARCGNIFGGGDLNFSRIVPGTIRSFLREERPIIRSDGTYIRDYLYVKDAVIGYIQLSEHLYKQNIKGDAFNLSPESPVTVLEMVETIQRLMQCAYLRPDIRNCSVNEIKSQYLDSSKAKKLLGWQTRFGLESGLKETIGWYKTYLEHSL